MKKNKILFSLLISLLSLLLIFSLGSSFNNSQKNSSISNKEEASNLASNSSKLIVHYIDVGQGDSELIQIPGKFETFIPDVVVISGVPGNKAIHAGFFHGAHFLFYIGWTVRR